MSGSTAPKKAVDQTLKKILTPNHYAKHLFAGSASGWVTGAAVGYAGKGVALLLGSGIIVYELAYQKGLVKQDLKSLTDLAKEKAVQNIPPIQKVKAFAAKNRVFSAGFLGGFLLGIAF